MIYHKLIGEKRVSTTTRRDVYKLYKLNTAAAMAGICRAASQSIYVQKLKTHIN